MREETTYSEELMKQTNWKDWILEYKYYVSAIICLSLISLSLMIQNYVSTWKQKAIPSNEVTQSLPDPPQKMAIHLHPKSSHSNDPLSQARLLADGSQLDKAIALLLRTSQNHKNLEVRLKASEMAKVYHSLRHKRTETEKGYLEAYVLYETYPEQACTIWKKLMNLSDHKDKSVQKAQQRYRERCRGIKGENP